MPDAGLSSAAASAPTVPAMRVETVGRRRISPIGRQQTYAGCHRSTT